MEFYIMFFWFVKYFSKYSRDQSFFTWYEHKLKSSQIEVKFLYTIFFKFGLSIQKKTLEKIKYIFLLGNLHCNILSASKKKLLCSTTWKINQEIKISYYPRIYYTEFPIRSEFLILAVCQIAGELALQTRFLFETWFCKFFFIGNYFILNF